MSRICGAFSAHHEINNLSEMIKKMQATLQPDPTHTENASTLHVGAIAGVNTSFANIQCDTNSQCNAQLILAGACFNVKEVALRSKIQLTDADDAALLCALIMEHGPEIIGELNGAFSFIYYNSDKNEMIAANDRYGYFPLYYYNENGMLLVSSECKAICAVQNVSPDPGGWGDFFYVQHMTGNRTLFREIKSLGPGEYIHWCQEKVGIKKYWDLSKIEIRKASDVSIKEIYDLFNQAVARRIKPDVEDTLLLSAGFDSRVILGSMLEKDYHPKLVTLRGKTGWRSLEHPLALQVAKAAGLECEVRDTKDDFFKSKTALEIFHVLDGMWPTFHHWINQLYLEIDESMGRVWDGLALDMVFGGIFQRKGGRRSNLWRFLKPRAEQLWFMKKVFRKEWFQEIESHFWEGLHAEIESYSDDDDGWTKFLINNRTRRLVSTHTNKLLNRKVQMLTPGADAEFLDYLLSVPASLRRDHELYISLFEYGYPNLTNVPVISGGGNSFQFKDTSGKQQKKMRESRQYIQRIIMGLGLYPHAFTMYMKTGGHAALFKNWFDSLEILAKYARLGLDREIYNKPYLEKAFKEYEKGKRQWLTPLAIVGYVELWNLLYNQGKYDELRESLA